MNDCSLELERVLGLTTLTNSSLLSAKNCVVYVAGCVAVVHSIDESKKKQYFQAQHAIACIAMSTDERYLAVGERGHNPKILVFEVATGNLLVSLENHKHGIGCVAFSPDGRYLVSASFRIDKQLCIWDWCTGKIVSSHKIGNKVNSISFSDTGNYFVTCGDRHLKWWHILYDEDGTLIGVTGQPAGILDTHAQSNFVDIVVLGSGCKEQTNNVYVITSTGLLCLFSSETRLMVKWVQVETAAAYSLSFHHTVVAPTRPVSSIQPASFTFQYLFVGCANGAIMCFSTDSLKYVAALPLPAPLTSLVPGRASIGNNSSGMEIGNGGIRISHPACTALRAMHHTTYHVGKSSGKADTSVALRKSPANVSSSMTLLAAVYADRSFFIWDVSALFVPPNYPLELRKDMKDPAPSVVRLQSQLFHRSCVWDLQFIDSIFGGSDGSDPTEDEQLDETAAILERGSKRLGKQLLLPTGTMVTGSTDGSIRFWNVSAQSRNTQLSAGGQNAHAHLMWKSPYSRDMLHSIDIAASSAAVDSASSSSIDNSKNNSRRPYVAVSSAGAVDLNSSTLGGGPGTLNAGGVASNIDLSGPVMNTEMPDRYLDDMAARAFCIHPSHDHVACGDKFGVLRVYNIVTMTLVQTIHAHVAEVLTMCYSPWMYYHATNDSAVGVSVTSSPSSVTGSGGWTVNRISSVHSNGVAPLLLLATAGRDRLIHVLDASKPGQYVSLITLDNHSASVTAVKFALDGKRLLSCGGDKTIVFNEVNGPHISRVKSVNTSHGTVMGLAIDATNKYAATTGQDKKLNIWSIKTGKFMRAYKHPDIQGDLFKCDIDPSGMYIAACTYDKKICIFDFFSGNLMTYIDSGHSELITSIRFSPNGKHLLTVAGDGCIMIWKIGTELVNSMQDRIVELYTSVRKKQQEQLHQLHMRASGVSMPSPPRQSVKSVDLSVGYSGQNPNFPPAPPPAFPSMQSKPVKNKVVGGKGAWADRQQQAAQGNLELFGRNVASSGDDASGRHKLTLELTANAFLEGDELGPRTRTLIHPPTHSQNPSLVPPSSMTRPADSEYEGVSSSAVSALTASTISDGDHTLDDDLDSSLMAHEHGSPRNTYNNKGIAANSSMSSPDSRNNSNSALSRSTSGRLALSMEDKFDDVVHGESDGEQPDAHLYDSPSDDDDDDDDASRGRGGSSDGDTITVDVTPPRKGKNGDKPVQTSLDQNNKAIIEGIATGASGNFSDDEDDVYGDKRSFTKGQYTITPRTKHALDKLELTKGVKASLQGVVDDDNDNDEGEDAEDIKEEKDTLDKFDTLEHSVSALENWLEDKLKQDTVVDATATAAAGDVSNRPKDGDLKNKTQPLPSKFGTNLDTGTGTDLKKSLSSDFFKKHLSVVDSSSSRSSSSSRVAVTNTTPGRSSKEVLAGANQKALLHAQTEVKDLALGQAQQSHDSSAYEVPSPLQRVDPLNTSSASMSSATSIGSRSIETAAAVSLMRDKLLNMGIIPEGKVTKKMKTSHDSAETSMEMSMSKSLPPALRARIPTVEPVIVPAVASVVTDGAGKPFSKPSIEEKPVRSQSIGIPIGAVSSVGIAEAASDTNEVSDVKVAPARSFEHKEHKSRSSLEFTQESYIGDEQERDEQSVGVSMRMSSGTGVGLDQSVAVEMDERDGYLGRNAHNNSLLTDDSGENNHVFAFEDSSEDEENGDGDDEAINVNNSTLGSATDADMGAFNDSGIDLLAAAASTMDLDNKAEVGSLQKSGHSASDAENADGDGDMPEFSEEAMQAQAAECRAAMEELQEATKRALQSYDGLKQLRYYSTRHGGTREGTVGRHHRLDGSDDSLLLSTGSSQLRRGPAESEADELLVTSETDADMVLYQFETSFMSMAQSAVGLFGTSLSGSTNIRDSGSISTTARGHVSMGASSVVSSFDVLSRASYASNGAGSGSGSGTGNHNSNPYAHRVPRTQQIPSTINELTESSPIKQKPRSASGNDADDDENDGDDSILPATLNTLTQALDAQQLKEPSVSVGKSRSCITGDATAVTDATGSNLDATASSVASAMFVPTDVPTATSSTATVSAPIAPNNEPEKSGEDAMMELFLSKYSDKLVDLLSDKIKNKLSADK